VFLTGTKDTAVCVEVASTLSAVRDSKNPNGPTLRVGLGAFLDAVKAGRLG
jgi:Domain of unknown function (DUF397)